MKYFFLFLSVSFASCASYRDSVKGLQDIHREPVGLSQAMGPTYLEYNVHVEEPVEFCMDQISELGYYSFSREMEKSEALVILSMTALRSPAMVVRASAVRALKKIFRSQVSHYQTPLDPVVPEECEEMVLALRKAAQLGEPQALRLEQIAYFTTARFEIAQSACMVLDQVIVQTGLNEKEDVLKDAFRKAAARMNGQAFFLTMQEAMVDHGEIVRAEALEGFFCFPWSAVRPALTRILEYNLYLQKPEHAIRILKHLNRVANGPEDLGIGILKHVNGFLASPHSGVVKHAIAVFVKITGMQEDDPRFWGEWWDEYLLKNAGEVAPTS